VIGISRDPLRKMFKLHYLRYAEGVCQFQPRVTPWVWQRLGDATLKELASLFSRGSWPTLSVLVLPSLTFPQGVALG
jgi:hypothetical protein